MAGIAALYVVETLFSALALLAVALRLWARHLTKRELALNDWAAIGALVNPSKGFFTNYLNTDSSRRFSILVSLQRLMLVSWPKQAKICAALRCFVEC